MAALRKTNARVFRVLQYSSKFRSCGVIPSRSVVVSIGAEASDTKSFTADDVKDFARISGDSNPIHLDPQFASKTLFKKCVVHGTLINGFIGAVLGTQLPGPGAILISQELRFLAPAYIGQPVQAHVRVEEMDGPGRRRVKFAVSCTSVDENKTLVKGNVVLLVPKESVSEDTCT